VKTRFFRVLFCVGFYAVVHGDDQLIIGGRDLTGGAPAYAALVSPGGVLTPFTVGPMGLPSTGVIFGVAINGSGDGIIGGLDLTGGASAYAALVSSGGALTSIVGLPSTGSIQSVAINESGNGIVGGRDLTVGSPAYAALVSLSGVLTPIAGLPSTGSISSVAINGSREGIIGGGDNSGSSPAYAALVSPGGALTSIAGLPSSGFIFSVAINESGVGIIGGQDITGSNPAYAAFVSSGGAPTPIAGLPSSGDILSVAINGSGVGIIGGEDFSGAGPAYAAVVSPGGALTPIGGLPSSGIIWGVAINESGAGIIGGEDFSGGSPAYAALVSPSGTLTPIEGLPLTGIIWGVAIDRSGAGIIGGQDITGSNPAYAAFVSPSGVLTPIVGLPSNGVIYSVAIGEILQSIGETLQFIGSSSAVSSMHLAASYAMTGHLGTQKFREEQTSQPAETTYLADNNKNMTAKCIAPAKKTLPYTIWIAPFSNYVRQNAEEKIPAINNTVAGGLIGFDYHPDRVLVGTSFGYAYNFVHYGQSLGHGHVQEEMLSFYAAYECPYFYMNAVLWGGFYQAYNERHSFFGLVTSIAHFHGWVFSPHVEIASPIPFTRAPWCIIQPFAMMDWVNNWQSHFREHGVSGFNVHLGNQYNSLLRSEAGLRFDQKLYGKGGSFVLEEKLSYVNQTPFDVHDATTFFTASISTFPIATGSAKIQQLGAGGIRITYSSLSDQMKVGLDFQLECNTSYQSYFGGLEFGFKF